MGVTPSGGLPIQVRPPNQRLARPLEPARSNRLRQGPLSVGAVAPALFSWPGLPLGSLVEAVVAFRPVALIAIVPCLLPGTTRRTGRNRRGRWKK